MIIFRSADRCEQRVRPARWAMLTQVRPSGQHLPRRRFLQEEGMIKQFGIQDH